MQTKIKEKLSRSKNHSYQFSVYHNSIYHQDFEITPSFHQKIIENQENIESIVKLDINNNHLTYLASEINCLKNLRSLNCNNNKLTSLPISIIELYNLTELNLYNNKEVIND